MTTAETLHGVTQKMLTLKVNQLNHGLLLEEFTPENGYRETARLRCLGNKHAGDWLQVVPSPSLGLNLRSAEFIVSMKYRLGNPI